MNSNSRCMRLAQKVSRAEQYSSGHKACMLAILKMSLINSRCLRHLCVIVASVLYCAGTWAASGPTDPAQAKAKLAAVRARIADLTNRLSDELKKRDALSARLREAELVITAKRQRLETLRAAEVAAERRRSELRLEQGRDQNALQAQPPPLCQQVRAAHLTPRQAHPN